MGLLASVLLVGAAALGCAMKKAQDTAAPASAQSEASLAPPPPEAEGADMPRAFEEQEGEPPADPMADMEAYEQQLRDYERRLARAGVRLRTGLPGGGVPGDAPAAEKEERRQRGGGGKSAAKPAAPTGGADRAPSKKKGPADDSLVGGVGGGSADEAAAPDRCETVCSLQEAICGLRDKICGLAEEHPEEMRYAEGCLRANDDCAVASEACDDCDD